MSGNSLVQLALLPAPEGLAPHPRKALRRKRSPAQRRAKALCIGARELMGMTPAQVAEWKKACSVSATSCIQLALLPAPEGTEPRPGEPMRGQRTPTPCKTRALRTEARDLVAMTPEQVAEWKKAEKYGPALLREMAGHVTDRDVPLLRAERDRLRAEVSAQLKTATTAEAMAAAWSANAAKSLKAQILHEMLPWSYSLI